MVAVTQEICAEAISAGCSSPGCSFAKRSALFVCEKENNWAQYVAPKKKEKHGQAQPLDFTVGLPASKERDVIAWNGKVRAWDGEQGEKRFQIRIT